MPNNNGLRLDPVALTGAGNALGEHGETLHAVQRAAHADATEAHSGWVGSSAAALAGLLDSWEPTSSEHIRRIGDHSCGMHVAAAEFTFMEQRHKQAFEDIEAEAGRKRPSAL